MPEGDEYWHVTTVSVAFLLWNSETNASYVSQLPIILTARAEVTKVL